MKTMHLSHLMRMLHEERMREMDPAASPGRILAFLRLAGEAPVGDMAMVLGARPRSMENTLSKLVEEGFVTREQGEDKRLDRVKLTEKGADPKNMPEGRASKVFATLTEEEREQLASILDKLNAGFEKELDLPEDPEERRAAMCKMSAAGWHHGFGNPHHGQGFGPCHRPGMM